MKRAKNGPEKIRDFKLIFGAKTHVNPQRRKIPEKSRSSTRGAGPFCGKERSSHALKSDDAGQS